NTFIRKQEEGLVLAVVEFRNQHRTAHTETWTIRERRWPTLASRISKEDICCPAAGLDPVVGRAMKLVGAGRNRQARNTALSVTKLSVVGCRLHFEFLGDVSRRNVRSNYLVGIRRRRTGGAVDQ